jgi:hypothetical protein
MISGFLQKVRRPLLIVGVLLALAASVAFSLYYVPKAHADGGCTATGEAKCQEVFAVGRNTPIYNFYYGRGGVFMERTLRAFMYSNTGDHERYMVYVITVTLNPDPNVRLANFVTSEPDSTPTGDNSTIHVRLWSINDRASCAGTPCNQSNYPDLEKINGSLNVCEANGGNTTWQIGKDFGGGITIGLSLSLPLYNWCTYVPSADIWSQYNNYTLQAREQSWTRISQQFVFAQWEPENCCGHQFKIGFSANTNLFDPGPKLVKPGPASGNASATFAY